MAPAVVARLQLLEPDAHREGRGLRVRRPLIQPIRFGELRLGGLILSLLFQRLAEASMRLRGRRPVFDGLRNCDTASLSAPCCFRTVPSM